MGQRVELQQLLEDLLGSRNVYFQPIENLQMQYPCIRYSWDFEQTLKANNEQYSRNLRYQLVYIDRNPDSDVPAKLSKLPLCRFGRTYTQDNLHHTVYDIYF